MGAAVALTAATGIRLTACAFNMSKAPTLFEAVRDFLGPLHAGYSRLIDEWDPETPVTINIGGYKHETTLATIKKLDHAYHAAFEAKQKRLQRKSRGTLI